MKYALLLLLVTFSFSLYPEELEEIAVLQELIATTEKNLAEEKALLKLFVTFQEAKEAFIAKPTSAKLATQLVKKATKLQMAMETSPFVHLFSSKLREEVAFFTLVGKESRG